METTTKSVKRRAKRKFKITQKEYRQRIKNGIRKAHAEGRKGGNPEYAKRDQILELRAQGKKYREICKILGCVRSTIWRAISLDRKGA